MRRNQPVALAIKFGGTLAGFSTPFDIKMLSIPTKLETKSTKIKAKDIQKGRRGGPSLGGSWGLLGTPWGETSARDGSKVYVVS